MPDALVEAEGVRKSFGSLEVLRGSISRRELAEALAWATENGSALLAQWKVLNP